MKFVIKTLAIIFLAANAHSQLFNFLESDKKIQKPQPSSLFSSIEDKLENDHNEIKFIQPKENKEIKDTIKSAKKEVTNKSSEVETPEPIIEIKIAKIQNSTDSEKNPALSELDTQQEKLKSKEQEIQNLQKQFNTLNRKKEKIVKIFKNSNDINQSINENSEMLNTHIDNFQSIENAVNSLLSDLTEIENNLENIDHVQIDMVRSADLKHLKVKEISALRILSQQSLD